MPPHRCLTLERHPLNDVGKNEPWSRYKSAI